MKTRPEQLPLDLGPSPRSAARTRRPAKRRTKGPAARPVRRSASVLIVSMFVLMVLGGMLLVFARSMRVEAIASANRLGAVKAGAIERAAEQFVLSQLDGTNGDALYLCSIPGQAIPVGDGYFWLLRPNPLDDQNFDFGLIDEASKLSLNTATDNQLLGLPNMSQDLADTIIDWRDSDENVTGQGAESSYYNGLPEPYSAKNAPFETVEELLLLKGPGGMQQNVTKDVLYGYDLNRNGVIDEEERSGAGAAVNYNGGGVGQDTRGMFPFVTVYTNEPNTDPNGKARVNVNDPNSRNALQTLLSQTITNTSRVQQIMATVAGTGNRRTFPSVIAWCQAAGLQPNEAGPLIPSLTTSSAKTLKGMVNVNTAPRQVLMALGLQQADADNIVNSRGSNSGGVAGAGGSGITMGSSGSSNSSGSSTAPTGSDLTWLLQALQPQSVALIAPYITTRSYQYSADIVAVTGDGGSFRRVRIVVDAQSSPPKILYRKDLTSLGWPLPPDLRQTMSQGQPPYLIQSTGGVGLSGQ